MLVVVVLVLGLTSAVYAGKKKVAVAGDVLISGGVSKRGKITPSAEYYRPSAGAFFKTGAMTEARAGHQSFEVGVTPETRSPIMFAFGGFRGTAEASGASYVISGSPIASIDTFNLSKGKFNRYPISLSVARFLMAAVPFPGDFPVTQVDGHILVVGGFSATGPTAIGELVDPTDVQDLTGNLNVARALATATLLNNGLVLVTGGIDHSGNASASAELFDPSDFTYTLLGSTMTTPRAGHTATLLGDGTVLIAGGATVSSGAVTALNSAEIYDPVSSTFTAAGNLNVNRVVHSAVALGDGTVLIAGGVSGTATLTISGGHVSFDSGSGAVLDNAEIYAPGSHSFACVGGAVSGGCASSMNATLFPTATLLANGSVLIAGGFSGGNPTNTAQIFSAGSFQNTGNMKTPRALAAAALLQ